MSEAFRTDEHELKRKFNETELPQIQLKARVLDELEAGSRHAAQRPARSRKLLAAVCSVMAAVAVLGALSAFPASADQLRKIPVVGKIFEGNIFSFAGDSGIVSGQQSGISTGLNEEASDKGVTIKLQDVIYDGARLSISYEMNSEKPDHLLFLGDVDVKINGIPSRGAALGTKPHRINERRSVGIMKLDLEESERAGRFDLELTIGEVTGFEEGEDPVPKRIRGEWSFKLTVANSAAESAYQMLADGYAAKSKGRQFQLTGYLATPATTKLDFRFAGDTEWLSFQLKDDRGMLIETLDTRFTTGKDGVTYGTVRFAPLAGGTKTIKVTPYTLSVGKKEREKVTAKLTDAFPIVLSQGEGEAIVKNVEFLHDKTLIYYEVKGKAPYMQYASLWLETEDGQMLISDNGKRTRIGDTSYDYVLEYPALDPQQPYVLGTMPQTDIKLLDELSVTLDVEE